MEEEKKNQPIEHDADNVKLSQEDIERMVNAKQRIIESLPRYVAADGKTYKVRQVSQKIRTKIDNLALTAYYLQQETQKEITLRKAKRLNCKLRNTHAKMAAYYLLGNWALFIPFLWAFKWRWLLLSNSETTARINGAGASDPDTGFYFANWEIIREILALSTKSVGEGIMQYEKRKESAESMAKEDDLAKADNKSEDSSKKRRITKR